MSTPPSRVTYQIGFQTNQGYTTLQIGPGSITLVAGPNGVGKSALLVAMYRSLPQGIATYLPGHRQINFNNGWETIGQDAAQLISNLFVHQDSFNRYKSSWAEDQFKTTIRRLLHAEAAYNREFRNLFSQGFYRSEESGSLLLSPIDTLNQVFSGARLPVQFELTIDGLSARREDATYQIDAMSDGERAALFIVASVVTQAADTVLLIDEPEKHLHPSITAGLLEACIRSRPDISIVVSSHDVFLIEQLSPDTVVHVRNSRVVSVRPENRIFDAAYVPDIDKIPEDLRTALLGSRSEILFVEGESDSADTALLRHVYEGIKIVPRGGHSKVKEAVSALSGLNGQHWLKPYGIIDGDGQNASEREVLAKRKIFVLPCPSIENVFFFEEMVGCYVEADYSYVGGASLTERLAALSALCQSLVVHDQNEIIALRTSWRLDRILSENKLSPAAIRDDQQRTINVNVQDIYSEVKQEVLDIIETGCWKSVLQRLPIKKTGLPNAAARVLGASSFKEYCNVILRQFDIRSGIANDALRGLTERLPKLR